MNAQATRRQLLGGMAVAAAAGAMPAVALAKGGDRSAWNRAVAQLRATEAQQERLGNLCSKLSDEVEAACPRREEFFKRYDLGCGISRSRNLSAARHNILLERLHLGGAVTLSQAEADQADAEAARVVDDFEAWVAKRDFVSRDYDEAEKLFDAAVDAHYTARQALFETAAPDNDALLFKVELLTSYIEAKGEDADKLAAVCSDARRLLSNGRA